MGRDPWRPMDIPDAILGRPTSRHEFAHLGETFDVETLELAADEVWVVKQPRVNVLWGMDLSERQAMLVAPSGRFWATSPREDH